MTGPEGASSPYIGCRVDQGVAVATLNPTGSPQRSRFQYPEAGQRASREPGRIRCYQASGDDARFAAGKAKFSFPFTCRGTVPEVASTWFLT